MMSLGRMIPASWHARRPSAAYCEFELSPPDRVLSRLRSTFTFRVTFGFTRTPGGGTLSNLRAPRRVPLATRLRGADVGTSSISAKMEGSPYVHCPFVHWLSTRNCAQALMRYWYFTRSTSSRIMAWSATQ